VVPGGSQSGEVGHRRAGDEPGRHACRQPEQVAEPGQRDVLGDTGHRTHDVGRRIDVSPDGQPVRGKRRRQGTAGDEAEVPRAGGGDAPSVQRVGQRGDHLGRLGRAVRGRPSEQRAQLVDSGARPHRPFRQAALVLVDPRGHRGEQVVSHEPPPGQHSD
jgi:hypothetical protein